MVYRTGREPSDIKNNIRAQQLGNDNGLIQPCFTKYKAAGNGQFENSIIVNTAKKQSGRNKFRKEKS